MLATVLFSLFKDYAVVFVIIVTPIVLSLIPKLLKIIGDRRRMVNLVEKIKGPPAIPLLGCMHLFKVDRWEFADQLIRFIIQYGQQDGIVRFWVGRRPIVTILRADLAEPILNSTELIEKSFYETLIPWLGTGLITSSGEKWHKRRKLLTPAFHYSILETFVQTFGQQAKVFVEQLQPFAERNEVIDIYPYARRCTLDIICAATMGVQIDAQRNPDLAYVKSVEQMNEIFLKRHRLPWLWSTVGFYLSGVGFRHDRCIKFLRSFTRKVIQERADMIQKEIKENGIESLKNQGKKLAILDLLLLMAEENKLSYDDIQEEVDNFMFAGHDTTASGITWALYFMATNPEVQEMVSDELDQVFEDSDRSPTIADLNQLAYLERVIKETMRVYPPAPMFARYISEDIITGGYTLPKGASLVISPYFIHRDPKYWGPDPEKFNPDNFLLENIAKRHPYSYIPFSAGSRNCIGQRFAMLEQKAVLSTLLRHFRMESNENHWTVKAVPEVVLRPLVGVNIRFSPRKVNSHSGK